jgi:hypothetical protein
MFTFFYFLQWRLISPSISLDLYVITPCYNTDKEHEFLSFLAFPITYVINIFHQSKIWNLLSWQTVFSTCCDVNSRTTVCKSFLHVMLRLFSSEKNQMKPFKIHLAVAAISLWKPTNCLFWNNFKCVVLVLLLTRLILRTIRNWNQGCVPLKLSCYSAHEQNELIPQKWKRHVQC